VSGSPSNNELCFFDDQYKRVRARVKGDLRQGATDVEAVLNAYFSVLFAVVFDEDENPMFPEGTDAA